MEPILDASEEAQPSPYSIKSFQSFLYALGLFVFFLFGVILQVVFDFKGNYIQTIFGSPVILVFPLSIVGFFRGIQSLFYESANTKLVIGLVGNLLLLLLIGGLVVVSLMDIY